MSRGAGGGDTVDLVRVLIAAGLVAGCGFSGGGTPVAVDAAHPRTDGGAAIDAPPGHPGGTLRLALSRTTAGADLANFPLPVHLTATSGFDFAAVTDPESQLDFQLADGTQRDLAYDVEHWDPQNKDALIWVGVPRVPRADATFALVLVYGAHATPTSTTAASVWTSAHYDAVWHMSGDLADTAAHHDGSPAAAAIDDGALAGAQGFTYPLGADVADSTALLQGSPDFSIELWLYASAVGSVIEKQSGGSVANGRVFADPLPHFQIDFTFENGPALTGPGTVFEPIDVAFADWTHVAYTTGGGQLHAFKDGAQVAQQSAAQRLVADTSALRLGAKAGAGGAFTGALDELRIASVARSASWFAFEYAAMTDQVIAYTPQP